MKIIYNKLNNNEIEVGLDEAGRGPLFGRVYAAAVNWGDTPINESVTILFFSTDSNSLNAVFLLIIVSFLFQKITINPFKLHS